MHSNQTFAASSDTAGFCHLPLHNDGISLLSLSATMAVDEIVSEPGLVAVLQIADQARDQAYGLLRIIDGSADAPVTAELQAEVAKQQKYLFTSLAHLRGLHRNACFSARETKARTAEARQEVDRLHLQLQNLYYEQRHLQGEIAACESYEYAYDDCTHT